MMSNVEIAIGDQVYVRAGDRPFGAVRHVAAHELVVNIENFGDVRIGAAAVLDVHDGKVVIDEGQLPVDARRAIGRAHLAEDE